MEDPSKSKASLMDLPNEILLKILFRSNIDIIHLACARVNHRLKSLVDANFDKIDHLFLREELFHNKDFQTGMKKFHTYVTTEKPNIKALTIQLEQDCYKVERSLMASLVHLKTLQYLDLGDWLLCSSVCEKALAKCFQSLPVLKFLALGDAELETNVFRMALKSVRAKTLFVRYEGGIIEMFGSQEIYEVTKKTPHLLTHTTALHLEPIDDIEIDDFDPWIFSRFPNVSVKTWTWIAITMLSLFSSSILPSVVTCGPKYLESSFTT